MRNNRTTSHRKITTYRLSPEMNIDRNSKQTTCLCRDTWGIGTLPAQRTGFNTLENYGHKIPTQTKRIKYKKEKIKGTWPGICIQYTRLHVHTCINLRVQSLSETGKLPQSRVDPCLKLLHVDSVCAGAGIAQWLERRTRDWKVAGSNPCWNGGRIFFSRVDFLCWLLFRYPFHPRVTTVARKKSRSFCQKCRWQVTAKHAYTLRIEPCFGIGHNLSLICQMTSEDIKHQLNNNNILSVLPKSGVLSLSFVPWWHRAVHWTLMSNNQWPLSLLLVRKLSHRLQN